jgi:hypothetical protein
MITQREQHRSELIAMHTYARPHGSATDRAFCGRWIYPLGAVEDAHGNLHVIVARPDGTASAVLWSCHTDTVHWRDGRQRVRCDKTGRLSLARREKRKQNCLGADDTVGVWLAVNLIRAKVPGHYVFHYGEEQGCIGSSALADQNPPWLSDIKFAIAFDRKGTGDVITHQMGRRTASDTFARSLAEQLNAHGLEYAPSEYGLFTDTEHYAGTVPECTNVSIGYSEAHGHTESVDTNHALQLLAALCHIDEDALLCKRTPSVDVWRTWTSMDAGKDRQPWPESWAQADRAALVQELEEYGFHARREDTTEDLETFARTFRVEWDLPRDARRYDGRYKRRVMSPGRS